MIANFWSPRSTLSPQGSIRGSGSVSSLSSDDNDFASEKEEVAFLRREVEALRAAAADRAAPVERPRGASPASDGKRREARAGRRRKGPPSGRALLRNIVAVLVLNVCGMFAFNYAELPREMRRAAKERRHTYENLRLVFFGTEENKYVMGDKQQNFVLDKMDGMDIKWKCGMCRRRIDEDIVARVEAAIARNRSVALDRRTGWSNYDDICPSRDRDCNWRPISSFYFTLTLFTTVGYGNFAPRTDLGKVFVCCFTLIGMIYAFATFNMFGERVAYSLRKLGRRIDEMVHARRVRSGAIPRRGWEKRKHGLSDRGFALAAVSPARPTQEQPVRGRRRPGRHPRAGRRRRDDAPRRRDEEKQADTPPIFVEDASCDDGAGKDGPDWLCAVGCGVAGLDGAAPADDDAAARGPDLAQYADDAAAARGPDFVQ
ncbi:potassium channel [Aureococcus anophagefferens]|nr:potassium channel [Aureococcus anophagefferens]